MTGHATVTKRDYGRGVWFSRCTEFGCHWRTETPRRAEAEQAARVHQEATA